MGWSPIAETLEDIVQIPIPTQTLPPHTDTNSFLVGRDEMGMIDAGLWDERGIRVLIEHFRTDVRGELRWLLLTHWHPDHRVGAEQIREGTGCKIGIHESEADRVPDLSIDFTVQDGDRIPIDGQVLEVIHTPGHSSGHCCFLIREKGVLFTGDHILGLGTSIIVPPDGDMTLYMDSLARLLSYPVRVICPGHGPIVWDAVAKINEYIKHRKEREEAILEGIRAGIRRTEDLVARVYTDVPESFHGMAYYTVEAHLAKLMKEGRVRKGPGEDGYEAVPLLSKASEGS